MESAEWQAAPVEKLLAELRSRQITTKGFGNYPKGSPGEKKERAQVRSHLVLD